MVCFFCPLPQPGSSTAAAAAVCPQALQHRIKAHAAPPREPAPLGCRTLSSRSAQLPQRAPGPWPLRPPAGRAPAVGTKGEAPPLGPAGARGRRRPLPRHAPPTRLGARLGAPPPCWAPTPAPGPEGRLASPTAQRGGHRPLPAAQAPQPPPAPQRWHVAAWHRWSRGPAWRV